MAKDRLTSSIEYLQTIDFDTLQDAILEIIFYHKENKELSIEAYSFLKFMVKTYEQWWCEEHASPEQFKRFEKEKDYID